MPDILIKWEDGRQSALRWTPPPARISGAACGSPGCRKPVVFRLTTGQTVAYWCHHHRPPGMLSVVQQLLTLMTLSPKTTKPNER
jgi:hypothetical protein